MKTIEVTSKNIFKRTFNKVFRKNSKVSLIVTTNQGSVRYICNEYDYENFAKETYMKNAIAFKCISEIAKAVSSVQWNVKTVENEKVINIESDPILDLLKRPNPNEGFSALMYKAAAYYTMDGNAYMERVSPETGPNKDTPRELYVHRPDRMEIVTENNTVKYIYTVNGQSVTWEVDPITKQSDILHLKTFHPLDDFCGMAATVPVSQEIDTSNEATNWNMKVFQNECRPGMVFATEVNLTDNQYNRLHDQLYKNHAGADNAGKHLILEGGKTNVSPYGWSPKEMDFIDSDRELSRKIANGYGVPSMLIGIPGDNTYSNYKEARLAFWEDEIIPLLNYFQTEFNNWFFNNDTNKNYYFEYNLDKIPALAPRREILWEKIQNANFLTINEKRKAVGYEEIPGGDKVLVPATMIDINDLSLTDDDLSEEATEDEKQAIAKLIEEGHTKEEAENLVLNIE
jgi:HK97 family phage portal protein